MKKFISLYFILSLLVVSSQGYSQNIERFRLLNTSVLEYEKAEWNISVHAPFKNPYLSENISLDMLLTSPSGRIITLPCFFFSGDSTASVWKARFAPQDTGTYTYHFRLTVHGKSNVSKDGNFISAYSSKKGFLHKNNLWTFRFDNGTLFRGIGENVGWESRKRENPKYTYNYLLPKLSKNGANFFRTWMCAWNLPLEWHHITDSNRYKSSNRYFNPDGVKRMDALVHLADSLGMYIMLTLDWHGELITHAEWKRSAYNRANGGPAATPTEFFTSATAQQKYKNKLRYIIARWGYSTSIAAFEFFNEIDNAAFTPQDSVIIPHSAITQWHNEMSRYIKDNDPYHHLVTTSISHREIMGLNSLPYIDFNQKHIYKHTDWIVHTLRNYSHEYNKPYVIGEFGYEWDWNVDFSKITTGLDYDFKRGLWYGLFSPTPILPMSWWWEFFDQQKMEPYFRGVRQISDQMLKAGNGSFRIIPVKAGHLEAYGVQCGKELFVYLLNNTDAPLTSNVLISTPDNKPYLVRSFSPSSLKYRQLGYSRTIRNGISFQQISLPAKEEMVLLFTGKK